MPAIDATLLNHRADASQPGRIGESPTMPEREAAEVERRCAAFELEMNPSGELGMALVRRAATLSVRMERCSGHENAAMTHRVRQAIRDFVPPEGVDEDEAGRLRDRAADLAMFDTSRDAVLARRYEAAAERGFFRALKEFRLFEKAARTSDARDLAADRPEPGPLGSFLDDEMDEAEFDAMYAEFARENPEARTDRPFPGEDRMPKSYFELPIPIGRPR